MYSKYDKMNLEHMNDALKCNNKHVIKSKYCMKSSFSRFSTLLSITLIFSLNFCALFKSCFVMHIISCKIKSSKFLSIDDADQLSESKVLYDNVIKNPFYSWYFHVHSMKWIEAHNSKNFFHRFPVILHMRDFY